MNISISTASIISQILATSAFASSINPSATILTPDSAPAIRRMARGAFSLIVMAIAPVVKSCDLIGSSSPDTSSPTADLTDFTLSLTLQNHPPSLNPAATTLLIEQAIIARIFCEAYTPVHQPTAARHASTYLAHVDRLRQSLTLSSAISTSIRPAWI